MRLKATPHFIKKLNKITKKNSQLSTIINKQLQTLIKNKNHPSLKLHKLSNPIQTWSISIKSNIRILFQYSNSDIILTDIGSHDEVY